MILWFKSGCPHQGTHDDDEKRHSYDGSNYDGRTKGHDDGSNSAQSPARYGYVLS